LVGKPEGKRAFRRPGRRWEDNIRMDLGEMGWEGVDWMCPTQDRDRWHLKKDSAPWSYLIFLSLGFISLPPRKEGLWSPPPPIFLPREYLGLPSLEKNVRNFVFI
jgi:hypothetical protein